MREGEGEMSRESRMDGRERDKHACTHIYRERETSMQPRTYTERHTERYRKILDRNEYPGPFRECIRPTRG